MYLKDGLAPPEDVVAATDEYKRSQDKIGLFITQECVEESNLRMKLKDFLEDYNSWCVTQGLQTIGAITLKEELTSRGFDVRESTGHVNWVFGVAPRPDELTLMTQKNRVNDTDLLK